MMPSSKNKSCQSIMKKLPKVQLEMAREKIKTTVMDRIMARAVDIIKERYQNLIKH